MTDDYRTKIKELLAEQGQTYAEEAGITLQAPEPAVCCVRRD